MGFSTFPTNPVDKPVDKLSANAPNSRRPRLFLALPTIQAERQVIDLYDPTADDRASAGAGPAERISNGAHVRKLTVRETY